MLSKVSICVTAASIVLSVLYKANESTDSERIGEDLILQSDELLAEADSETKAMPRLQYLSMSLSLLMAARSISSDEKLERRTGIEAHKRLKKLRKAIHSMREQVEKD